MGLNKNSLFTSGMPYSPILVFQQRLLSGFFPIDSKSSFPSPEFPRARFILPGMRCGKGSPVEIRTLTCSLRDPDSPTIGSFLPRSPDNAVLCALCNYCFQL
jgi:hypothetical protein